MRLNDLTGRSFNDLSQYYIFPWTVINFVDVIDAKFFCRPENFRDLSLPVGKLNKSKWEEIKKKYEMKK
jgi:vacuolar-type H+-ATPase subunit C/Vma6